jgi:hypothetical protein
MNKVTVDLMIKPTGDVDRDFVAMMVPPYQAGDRSDAACGGREIAAIGGIADASGPDTFSGHCVWRDAARPDARGHDTALEIHSRKPVYQDLNQWASFVSP